MSDPFILCWHHIVFYQENSYPDSQQGTIEHATVGSVQCWTRMSQDRQAVVWVMEATDMV
jgi:hypothetical protein